VLAHEISHLAGGHLARLRQVTETTTIIQAISTVLGAGAMVAAGATGSQTLGGMAGAFVMASQSAGVNSLMAYRRSEESNADAGAIALLEATRQSGRGMVEVLEGLGASQAMSVNSSPYLLTHPLAEDRLNQLRDAAARGRYYGAGDSAADIRRLEFAKAKLVGFLESQQTAMARYPNSDRSLPARYARVITAYRAGAGISAVQQMPNLIAEQPSNPYFHELYGQMLFETGQPARALDSLRRAVELAPNDTEIRVLYAQALIAAGGETNVTEAVTQLSRATREKPDLLRAFIFLGRAYEMLGLTGEASLAGAEAALVRGDLSVARGLARQAQQQLNSSTPAWLRADDILNVN
jgi:predicted Zn-dependent protease